MTNSLKLSKLSDEEFQHVVETRRVARMDAIDRMPPALRELVHDYGLNVVKACTDLGITKPNQIKHLVETVLDEFSPTRGTGSAQGARAMR